MSKAYNVPGEGGEGYFRGAGGLVVQFVYNGCSNPLAEFENLLDGAIVDLEMMSDLKGTNGLTSKLNKALDLVEQAVTNGDLTVDEAIALLEDARNMIGSWKNQVQGKINAGQITQDDGDELLGQADDALELIDQLESLLLAN